MALSDYFKKKLIQDVVSDAPEGKDLLMLGVENVGHILEISNGYIVVLIGDYEAQRRSVALYVPTLDKIGEALAANKAKNKFLHDPEATTTNKLKLR